MKKIITLFIFAINCILIPITSISPNAGDFCDESEGSYGNGGISDYTQQQIDDTLAFVNNATQSELDACVGISSSEAANLVAGQPYTDIGTVGQDEASGDYPGHIDSITGISDAASDNDLFRLQNCAPITYSCGPNPGCSEPAGEYGDGGESFFETSEVDDTLDFVNNATVSELDACTGITTAEAINLAAGAPYTGIGTIGEDEWAGAISGHIDSVVGISDVASDNDLVRLRDCAPITSACVATRSARKIIRPTHLGTFTLIDPFPYMGGLEEVPIHRLRIELKTGTATNADTDDAVYVQIGKKKKKYWLNRGGNDREKGDTEFYNILLKNTGFVKRITRLTIGKVGNDGWCLKRVKIFINSSSDSLFRKQWNSCKWIDGNDGHPSSRSLSYSDLRSYSGWHISRKGRLPKFNEDTFQLAGSVTISDGAFESTIETYMGHLLRTKNDLKDLYWGGKTGSSWVASKHPSEKGRNWTRVDLDLKYSSFWPDPNVDLDFDIKFTCNSKGQIVANSKNVKVDVDYDWVWDILSFGLLPLWGSLGLEPLLLDAWDPLHVTFVKTKKFTKAIEDAIGTGITVPATYACPTFYVSNPGDITFNW